MSSAAYNDLNQVTSVTGTGTQQLMISGSLSESGLGESGTVTVAGASVTTDSNYNFTAYAPVTAGSNNIPISATDVNGNVTNKTLGVNVTAGSAIPSLTYDANGNLTSEVTATGTTNFVWDMANRLVKIWYGPIGSSSNTSMNYDGFGRRVQIIETGSTGGVTSTKNLIWDGMAIREERNASNAVTKMYFDNGVRIGGTNYYYTRDHLGSIRELTGTNELVQARYDYDPYGQQTQLSGTIAADFGFTDLYYHQQSGLLLAAYREYSPVLGRWISRDPIGEKGGINLYGYVRNSPIGRIDRLGLQESGEEGSEGRDDGLDPWGEMIGKWINDLLNPPKDDSEKENNSSGSSCPPHGNSLNSPKQTSLYSLWDNNDNFLKWGITSEEDPEDRYSNDFMSDKTMNVEATGSRYEMAQQERQLVEQFPGPMNNEPWAGSQSPDTDTDPFEPQPFTLQNTLPGSCP